MINMPILAAFSYLFVGQILAFSLCFAVVERVTRPVVIWLLSNLLTAIGFSIGWVPSTPSPDVRLVIGTIFVLFGGGLKALALSDRNALRRSNIWAHIFLVAGLLAALMLIFAAETPYRMLLISTSGLLTSVSALLYLKGNRAWIGMRPTALTGSVLLLSAIAFVSRIATAYPFGNVTRFIEGNAPLTLLMLSFFQFMLQVGFLGLIVSRQSRERQFRTRRSGRIKIESLALKQMQRETAALADERFHLLKMLTHEVRQPLNTAQAALESVIHEVGNDNTRPENVRPALDRALVTLNSIALSISNSILGATLIAKGRVAHFQMIDLCSLSQLALLDIIPGDRVRIEYFFDQDAIFAEADPIVLRLAIRNLLENALKFSPVDSKISFEIQLDEQEMTAVCIITNEIADLSLLEGDIFGRQKRGADRRYEGFGLGLYIVKEVAAMHRGRLDFAVTEGQKVRFELHLPC